MNILWLTDIHLDYLSPRERRRFLQRLAHTQPNFVLVGGDTSKASSLVDDLRAIRQETGAPVYFVLGNHDYFGSSFSEVHDRIRKFSSEQVGHYWLENMNHIELIEGVALVGHGCWGDAGIGSYWESSLSKEMPDFREIDDLKVLNRFERLQLLKKLGVDAAGHLKRTCQTAAKEFKHVIVLTHVPPFPQSVLNGGNSNGSGLPFFCCMAAGKVLREVAEANPGVQFTVLSGHTHNESRLRVAPNLEAIVQVAQYHRPAFMALNWGNGRVFVPGVS